MAVTDYQVIFAKNLGALEAAVNAAIANEWQPQGGLLAADSGRAFYQPMVKLADEPIE